MADRPLPKTCTYDTYSWHVKKRRAVKRQRVVKPYAEVTGDERDPDDPRCTVCLRPGMGAAKAFERALRTPCGVPVAVRRLRHMLKQTP